VLCVVSVVCVLCVVSVVSVVCCVLSARGLWVGLITHPEKSYLVWSV
jgi:hypothetical protein